MAADTAALARMLYALLTGYWPGDEPTALPPAPRHKGNVCTPRQIRAGVPAMLDAIAYRGLQGQAADAPLRPQTPAGMAMALQYAAAAVLPAGTAGERTRRPARRPAAGAARQGQDRLPAPHHAGAVHPLRPAV